MNRSERYFEMKEDPIRWLAYQRRRAEQNKQWHAANREHSKENLKKWRAANPEKVRAQQKRASTPRRAQQIRAWREKNRARYNLTQKLLHRRNRDKINAVRRARRRAAGYTEKDRQEKRRYYARHAQKVKKKAIARYRAIKSDPRKYNQYRARARDRLRSWRKRNPSKNVAYTKAYKKRNPEKARKWGHARYIRKKGWRPAGSHTIAQWLARVAFYGWRCVYCGLKLSQKTLTKDHRIPLSKGGTEFASNLVPACRSCNSSKGNRKSHRNG